MLLFGLAFLILASCAGPRATAGLIGLEIQADGQTRSLDVPAGTTVQQAIDLAGIALGTLDRVEPPGYTVLTDGSSIQLTRVAERFEIQSITMPFEHQTIRNEALPEGETRLLQPGQNGLQEVTYRIVEEGGIEVSRAPVQTIIVQEPVAEIIMIGAQVAYTTLPVEGTLAYASGGNAWVMRDSSGSRRPVVVTGDIDGRVFRLSPDGRWLLFTRRPPEGEEGINSLWAVSTTETDPEPIDLDAENVIHFADWAPTVPPLTVAYSTVEPSPSAPGWQANNDLILVSFSASGRLTGRGTVLEPSAGGQYGWWGTSYAWNSTTLLAYARADGVGTVDLRDPALVPLLDIVPLQTLGDWAWVPGVSWGRDGRTLFMVEHGAPVGMESPAASPAFDIVALNGQGQVLPLVRNAGMFAAPVASPEVTTPGGEAAFQIAFLQALSPLESSDSRYRLVVMDRDGSNQRALFPALGEPGLEPQTVAWSPDAARVALIYRGDLWVVDVATGAGQPLTGDGQTTALDWKP